MSGGKTMQSSVSFTLPISCQICLGKVKEPVTCSNQHVFCSNCMNVWLDRNSRCPTCRVEITSQSPIKKIIGGNLQSHNEPVTCRLTLRELRRVRHELVRNEYEDEILALENQVDNLQSENNSLKGQLKDAGDKKCYNATCSFNAGNINSVSCLRCENIKDLDTMLDLTKKLQEATKTYGKMKQQFSELKKNNDYLLKRNDDLKREKIRIRQEVDTRSPLKYGRLTVATLEARLESAEKQVTQLQKALKRNDTYTEQLESELKLLKSMSQQESNSQFADKVAVKTESSIPLQQTDTCNDILTRAFDSAIQFNSPCSKSLETYNDSLCLGNFDETSKASSYAEMISFDGQFSQEFPGPATFSETPPSDVKMTFSRKLKFEEPAMEMPHSSQDTQHMITSENIFSIEDALGMDFASDVADSNIHSHSMTSANESTLNAVVMPPCGDENSQSSSHFNSQSSTSSVMKTTIDAGGSRITMSQLSAEEHDLFSRPNSAPSRTFLLSGSRFSALRPLDPAPDPSSGSDFQPVKCISPMHMMTNLSKESEEKRPASTALLKLVNPGDVMNTRWRSVRTEGLKGDDEFRIGRDALSRVNILKKKSTASKPVATEVTMTSSPPMSDNRRKQKFQKRSGEMSFQTTTKSPKLINR